MFKINKYYKFIDLRNWWENKMFFKSMVFFVFWGEKKVYVCLELGKGERMNDVFSFRVFMVLYKKIFLYFFNKKFY